MRGGSAAVSQGFPAEEMLMPVGVGKTRVLTGSEGGSSNGWYQGLSSLVSMSPCALQGIHSDLKVSLSLRFVLRY